MNTDFPYDEHRSLRPFNTFGIEATARYLTEVRTLPELQAVLASERFRAVPKLFLGGGSNVLFTQDFNGLVVRICLTGIETVRQTDAHAWLKAGAGVGWHALVEHTISRDLGGLENLSLIPGTTGAAPMQNIGAYGVEMKDTFDSLEAVDVATGALRTFSHAECRFGYRESAFKHDLRGRYVIVSVTCRLAKHPSAFSLAYGDIRKTLQEMGVETPTLRAVSDAVIRIRRSKLPHPEKIGNAGSFFKNPVVGAVAFARLLEQHPDAPSYPAEDGRVKVPAGWLIERCGWKGRRFGQAGVHDRQALVLVNYGKATGAEIRQLSQDIQASVLERFGIALQTEVNFV